MLLWLSSWLAKYFHVFHVFQYLTLRAILSTLTSLMIALLFGPRIIRQLSVLHVGQVIREDGPQSHLSKKGTPTMGGTLVIISILISTLLWAELTNRYIWIILFITLSFGFVGYLDDYRKLV